VFVIYAYDPTDEVLCSVAADAAYETTIKYIITVADAKATECSFLLIFIILPLIFHLFFRIKDVYILEYMSIFKLSLLSLNLIKIL
jgi:hypothetical protein